MAGFREKDKAFFPIKNIQTVIDLFRSQLDDPDGEPDLALLSIVAGAVENSLTCPRSATTNGAGGLQVCEPVGPTSLPVLELHTIQTLYAKFHHIMESAVSPKAKGAKSYATRELVKKVSDVVWNSLTRSYYKDRAHLQSLYSYLTGSKLDCFGVAFAVVAGCQSLGYSDVHLALSEDHAWVVFGEGGRETAEVTWHGKGNEDKRGQEIGKGVSARSWLYVNNRPVVCTRQMETAALVSAINPSLNATLDAFEVALLQQELLWLLYDLGHLRKYPMAIGNLGDLEEIAPKEGRIPCSTLFEQAISSARTYYNNQHVYPYTYQGGYFYRNKMYKEAFESWANASDVIRLYNYSRDDEEIYKEFLEIANELIPHIMKVESSGFSANTILKKPECFANLLRFYDGICQWEEGSATPVLHIGWAKPLVHTISKFDADVRAQVDIVLGRPEDDASLMSSTNSSTKQRPNGGCFHNNNNNNNINHMTGDHERKNGSADDSETAGSPGGGVNSNNNNNKEKDQSVAASSSSGNFHPSIEALTAACSEKILNPEYLLQGDGSPFVGGDDETPSSGKEKQQNGKAGTSKQEISSEHSYVTTEDRQRQEPQESSLSSQDKSETPCLVENKKETEEQKPHENGDDDDDDNDREAREPKRPTIVLHSQKMKELKDLLLAEKLNTHAISLHLTAQSQVQVGKKGRTSSTDAESTHGAAGMRPKRARRE